MTNDTKFSIFLGILATVVCLLFYAIVLDTREEWRRIDAQRQIAQWQIDSIRAQMTKDSLAMVRLGYQWVEDSTNVSRLVKRLDSVTTPSRGTR